jgi:phosphomevalonate kinase
VRAIAASAPGKAVLIGEYAVLEGAPAIAVAVDRRARVLVQPGDGPDKPSCHRVFSANSGAQARFRAPPDATLEWLDGDGGAFRLLEHVWRAVTPTPGASLALTLDTRDFYAAGSGAKLGLGSSAALAVALTAALAGAGAESAAVQHAALAAHRALQQGGSGIDVAAAVHGGVICYRREGLGVERLPWPAGLQMTLLWSGREADTAARIAALARAGAGREAALAELGRAAAAACREWPRGGTAALEAVGAWAGALQRFARRLELDVFGAGHAALYAEALRRGLVYKPCGAGGGDVGAAFAQDGGALEDFAAWAAGRGFSVVAAAPDERGVTREE